MKRTWALIGPLFFKQVQNVDQKVGQITIGSDYAKHYLVSWVMSNHMNITISQQIYQLNSLYWNPFWNICSYLARLHLFSHMYPFMIMFDLICPYLIVFAHILLHITLTIIIIMYVVLKRTAEMKHNEYKETLNELHTTHSTNDIINATGVKRSHCRMPFLTSHISLIQFPIAIITSRIMFRITNLSCTKLDFVSDLLNI